MRIERGNLRITDFHSHLMPGVDDGARDPAQARSAVAAMHAAGVATAITTPHFNASLTLDPAARAARLAELDAAWNTLQAQCEQAGVRLERGAEVALDVPRPDLSDPRLRLAGTRFVLVEWAFMNVPPGSTGTLAALRADGCIPIVAHPERYPSLTRDFELAREWRAAGAHLQVNGASLLGRYGDAPRRIAQRLLENGLVDYLCSDYHARSDPGIRRYAQLLEEMGGEDCAQLLLEINPGRLLQDEPPLPLPPLRLSRRGLLERVRRIFR